MLNPFLFAVTGLTSCKLWHDTLRAFVPAFTSSYTRALLEQYLSWNAAGIMFGGILAGFLTDSITPSGTFPTSVAGIGIISIILILTYKIPLINEILFYLRIGICILLLFMIIQGKSKSMRRVAVIASVIFIFMTICNIDLRMNLIFLRGIAIAIGMNSAYVAVGDIYKGSPFLPKASNYLYLALFGSLALCPKILEYLPKQVTFIISSLLMIVLSVFLKRFIPKTKSNPPSFRRYFKSWPLLLSKPEFLLVCGVSMLCIGGFYNIIYIFTDASIHNNYSNSISNLQSIGRWCTFAILFIIYAFNISKLQTSNKNCSQYMSLAMLGVSISAILLLVIHLRLPTANLGIWASCLFWLMCISTGFAQPAAKTGIICIAQHYGNSITGSAQSFVTLLNSAIDYGATKLILKWNYLDGARLYLIALISVSTIIAFGIFLKRKKINKTISS